MSQALIFLSQVLRCQCDEWNQHLFERYTSVLEGVAVVGGVVVVVVGVGEEIVAIGKNVGRGEVWSREPELFRVLDFIHLLLVVAEILPHLVAEVGVGVFVAHHLYCVVYMDCAVVGGKHHSCTAVSHFLEKFVD